MRLGAPVYGNIPDPETWIKAVLAKGYRAAYCPVEASADDNTVQAYERVARDNDVVIAEVGAWSNPMAPDATERAAALQKCKAQLDLADRIGARCCVNIAGSCSEVWDGPHISNYDPAVFDQIVETTREIIDAVKPKRSCYSLEPMPWMIPDSPTCYLRLMGAIDRDGFGVHLDPVNMVNSPVIFLHNTAFLKDCFEKLGQFIRSIHAKDMTLSTRLTTHLDEVRPGLGGIDYRTFVQLASQLPDVPFMLEHLPGEKDYDEAAAYVRSVCTEVGVDL